MFIAHAESKHLVRFAREHVVAACASKHSNNIGKKYKICLYIFSLDEDYNKYYKCAQRKNKKVLTKALTNVFCLSILEA
jgi:hypothetical protein